VRLPLGLDALGDDDGTRLAREVDHPRDERAAGRVAVKAVDDRPVKLDEGRPEFAKVSGARSRGASS
jgi:hypothetical protein